MNVVEYAIGGVPVVCYLKKKSFQSRFKRRSGSDCSEILRKIVQTRGPATLNALSPSFSLFLGMKWSWWPAERSEAHNGTSATGVSEQQMNEQTELIVYSLLNR